MNNASQGKATESTIIEDLQSILDNVEKKEVPENEQQLKNNMTDYLYYSISIFGDGPKKLRKRLTTIKI